MKDRITQTTFLESTTRQMWVCKLTVIKLCEHRQPSLQKPENTESTIKMFLLLSHIYIKAFFVYASKSSSFFLSFLKKVDFSLPPIGAAIPMIPVNKN